MTLPYGDDPRWETGDGSKVPVSKLPDRHLTNIIALLRRRIRELDEGGNEPSDWALDRIVESEEWLDVLEAEQERRKTFSW